MEISKLIDDIRRDNSDFAYLLNLMEPLINKYSMLLYKDEKDDTRSEMILALWEAITKIKYNDNSGQCMNYICTSLKYKYLELYRKSRVINDKYILVDSDEMDKVFVEDSVYDDIDFYHDLKIFLTHFDRSKSVLYEEMMMKNQTDSQIAIKYNMSRQYVNRLRRNLYSKLREEYIINESVA